MNVDNRTLQEMLAEIAPTKFQEGDYTVRMVQAEHGVSERKARKMLEDLEAAGKVVKMDAERGFLWRKV